ncbi:hypothetical protein DDZ18_08645 [Marinicauda salina]|uniref:Cell division protein FtsQ n=1 Tax=Marinicauda salina TaxID=2135793 RepID=A0A2U2BUS6_9PROT|nr:FtsQ-type POTRA domain-containing protein [Marinicauda salina]PWE17714.1 hypothetical protein DDZ18_08645 [Marinicauda salina]
MPKVRRAGDARGSGKKQHARSRRNARKTAPERRRKVANWASARLRAARYRGVHALRLAGFAAMGVLAVAMGLAWAAGRLDDMGARIHDGVAQRMAAAGFTPAVVEVAGSRRVSAEEIARVIGVEPGASMLSLDPAAAREAVEALSWVEHATVARLWPDRIAVRLAERRPYALWQNEGRYRVVDRSGVVIEAADPGDYADLPRVVGAGANTAAVEILTLLARQPTVSELVTHAVRVGERRWNLRLAGGGDVMLPEEDPASALAMIAALHADRGVLHLDARTFDLRNEGDLVIRAWPDRASEAPGRGA